MAKAKRTAVQPMTTLDEIALAMDVNGSTAAEAFALGVMAAGWSPWVTEHLLRDLKDGAVHPRGDILLLLRSLVSDMERQAIDQGKGCVCGGSFARANGAYIVPIFACGACGKTFREGAALDVIQERPGVAAAGAGVTA